MNGKIKSALIFAAGAGLGALGTAQYFFDRAKKACREYEEKCNKDYEELRAQLQTTSDYLSASLKKTSEEKIASKPETPEPKDYTQFYKEPEDVRDVIQRAEAKLAEEEAPMENDIQRTPKLKGPKLIPVEDFGNNRTLDQIDLYYYTESDTVTNEDDEVLDGDTVAVLIGDALTKFDFKHNPVEEHIYVRNEKHGADFQITKIKAPYRD